MNKFKLYFTFLVTTTVLFSCQKEDPVSVAPPRDYTVQYIADSTDIENYLKSHYITVLDSPGEIKDQDVTIQKTEGTSELSIWDQTKYKLESRLVKLHGVTYKIYYLVVRQGSRGEDSPTNTDAVFAAYSGSYLKSATDGTVSATDFEEVIIPTRHLSLLNTIRGWSEIFPQFNPGSYIGNEDGSISYYDFGAGVMFLPSGLAYYNSSASSIPSYSPLVFSFKLYTISRFDSDLDGVPNYLEDLDRDGYMYSFLNNINYPEYTDDKTNNIWYYDDTDRDGIPNFLDIDDDGDGYSTKLEREKGSDYLDKLSIPN
jgi:hypothetical protein